uniref:Uncharacterized protein n=1 Tax=Solanum lycopersicum TaxID=4081 RepID=A0A3Q7GJ35_SOLLC
MLTPLPTLNKAYSLVINHESQRSIAMSTSVSKVSEVLEGAAFFSKKGSQPNNNGRVFNSTRSFHGGGSNSGGNHNGRVSSSGGSRPQKRESVVYEAKNSSSYDTSQGVVGTAAQSPILPSFTPEQYQQILHLLNKTNDDSSPTIQTANADNKVHLPTGHIVSVAYTGSSKIFSDNSISNVLVLPEFKFNLLSVSRLTRELKCSVSFFPDFCIFQDLSNGMVKGIGREEHVARSNEGIVMCQKKYALELVAENGMSGAKPASTPFEINQKLTSTEYDKHVSSKAEISDGILENHASYQRLVGKLL